MKSVYGNHRHVLFQEVTSSVNTVLTQMFLRGSLLQILVILDVRVCILPSVASSDTATLQTKNSSQQSLHATHQTWLGISNAFSIAMLSKKINYTEVIWVITWKNIRLENQFKHAST